MVPDVLISRRSRSDSSVSLLKVDFHHVSDFIGIRCSRDSGDALGIEVYYLIKLILARTQGRAEGPGKGSDGTRTRISESVGRIAGLISRHTRVRRGRGS